MNLTRHRSAVALAFATQGLVFISLTTRLPDIKDRWAFSEIDVSLVLLAIVLLAGAGSVLTERLAARVDSALLLRVGLVVIGVGMPLMVAATDLPLYYAGVASYGVGLGIVDATTNMQAVALEHRYRRPILPSFHGAWTAGGLVGAGLTLASADLPLSAAAAIAAVPLVVALLPFLPPDEEPDDLLVQPAAADLAVPVPWRPIVMVGLGMVIFYMVDTASQTWGAVYLDEVFDAPSRWVALATLPYLVASLVTRLAGDGLVARYGAVPVLRCGAVIACAGLVVVTLAPSWPVAVLGFAVVGFGISVVAPLSFSAAAAIAGTSQGGDRRRVDVVIARFNQFNYVGGLLGAVLTGLVGSDDLRFGFCVPMVLVLSLWPLARYFAAVPGPAPAPPDLPAAPGTSRHRGASEGA
ncbi:MFS transporter [Nocardioides sambongensis]|uniref:MFS transporter n=1 Tax=Nocardioides sambongensis TaxID=2589074 RepID=UPI00112AFFEA|nr:MFS transporter [Nocardioides sambongensis]